MTSPELPITSAKSYCWNTPINHGKVKVGGSAIGAALAALIVIAGVFLILAGQGFQLGKINAIAQMVDAKWIYIAMGLAGATLTGSLLFLVISLKRAHATVLTQEADDGELAQDGPRVRDDSGKQAKTELELADVKKAMGPAAFNRMIASAPCELGRYQPLSVIVVQLQQVWPLKIHCNEQLPVRFFSTKEARDLFITDELSSLFHQEEFHEINHAVAEALRQLPALLHHEYWPYEVTYNEKTFFAVAYRLDTSLGLDFFATEADRTEWMDRKLPHATNAKVKFESSEKTETYTDAEQNALMSEWDLQNFRAKPIRASEYRTENLSLSRLGSKYLFKTYALSFLAEGTKTYLYFKTDEQRQNYIAQHLEDKIDVRALEEVLNKSMGVKDQARSVCKQKNDYFIAPCDVNGKILFVIYIYKGETPRLVYQGEKPRDEKWEHDYRESAESLSQALSPSGIYGQSRGYRNAITQQHIAREMINFLVIKQEDYWSSDQYVYYRNSDGQLAWEYLANGSIGDFLNRKNLTHNVRHEFSQSEEYPQACGVHLMGFQDWEGETKIVPEGVIQKYTPIAKNDCIVFESFKIKDWEVFTLLYSNSKNEPELLYFKTSRACETFCRRKGLMKRSGYFLIRN